MTLQRRIRRGAMTLLIWSFILALLVGGCALSLKSDTKRGGADIGQYPGDGGP